MVQRGFKKHEIKRFLYLQSIQLAMVSHQLIHLLNRLIDLNVFFLLVHVISELNLAYLLSSKLFS